MTIREIEARAGIDRANIRFYEREGLLSPARLDNGYREYSEEDLQMLLRIKLLRGLHIPLDEIRALKSGERALADTLAAQLSALERERRSNEVAQNICRAMREERASFAALDAARYLEQADRASRESGAACFAQPADAPVQPAHPWRRYFARMTDLSLYSLLWALLVGFVFGANLTARSGLLSFLDAAVTYALMLFLEPLLLHLTGTTPGKALFGFSVRDENGAPLSYSAALDRTWLVLYKGMGFGLPVYNLIRLYKSYRRCCDGTAELWDEVGPGVYLQRDIHWARALLCGAVNAAVVFLIVVAMLAQMLPPNRGSLTVGEFAENYNYYADYLDAHFEGWRLGEDGAWVEDHTAANGYYSVGSAPPVYRYTLENGALTGVSFDYTYQSGEEDWPPVGGLKMQMQLCALSFVCAQREVGLFSNIPGSLSRSLFVEPLGDRTLRVAGVVIASRIEAEGYDRPSGEDAGLPGQILIISGGESGSYSFRLAFSASLEG